MDLGFTEDQLMIKKSAREFLEKECSTDFVREMEEDERGYSEEMWKKMAAWQRYVMVKNGLLKPNSPRGVWEITEKGKKFLEDNK